MRYACVRASRSCVQAGARLPSPNVSIIPIGSLGTRSTTALVLSHAKYRARGIRLAIIAGFDIVRRGEREYVASLVVILLGDIGACFHTQNQKILESIRGVI